MARAPPRARLSVPTSEAATLLPVGQTGRPIDGDGCVCTERASTFPAEVKVDRKQLCRPVQGSQKRAPETRCPFGQSACSNEPTGVKKMGNGLPNCGLARVFKWATRCPFWLRPEQSLQIHTLRAGGGAGGEGERRWPHETAGALAGRQTAAPHLTPRPILATRLRQTLEQ
jgi:hypothetical protein